MLVNSTLQLSEEERNRIRDEMRYASVVVREMGFDKKAKGFTDKLLSYLSNGFVLLLIGSLITSFLVPRFQRQHEKKKQEVALMQECLSQFLLYTNSIWQEYYLLFPLIHEWEIDKETYNRYLDKISTIKLQRYDAFAKVEAIGIVFRKGLSNELSGVEKALVGYAKLVNEVSEAIDTWLRNIYCGSGGCRGGPGARVDPEFNPYAAFTKIQKLVLATEGTAKKVSRLMVQQIKSSE